MPKNKNEESKKKKPINPLPFGAPEPNEEDIPEEYDDPDDPDGVKPMGELPDWMAEAEPD